MSLVFQTERLNIRHFTGDDLDNLFTLHSDAAVMRFSARRSPESRVETQATLKRLIDAYTQQPGFGIWLAEMKTSGEFVGWLGIGILPGTTETEIGYRLLKK